MNHELICAWLGLPNQTWPPDHYTLLALPPGEANAELIEQRVHERLERVRRYQLAHPELVTEAMNRLAQAFVCLTDPVAKQTYDRERSPAPPDPAPDSSGFDLPPEVVVPSPSAESIPEASDPLAWLFGSWNTPGLPAPATEPEPQQMVDWETAPPPARLRAEASPPREPDEPAPSTPGTTATAETGAAPTEVAAALPSVRIEPAATPPRHAPTRRGLGTKRALYYRISRTRQLFWAWEQAGKYLNSPTRLLTRPAEATELIHLLQTIRELLRTFPPLLGEAGQPGYLVVALARQQLIVPTFQTLLPSQRQALARDWQAGQALLVDHRQFLRQELRGLRHRSRFGRAGRALKSACTDHPGFWLFLLALVALNLALASPLGWPEQIVILVVLVGFRVLVWWDSLRPTKLIRPIPRTVRPARPRPKTQRQNR